MMEWIESAWMGWQNYKDGGRLVALLLIILLIFWFIRNELRNEFRKGHITLFLYTTVMAICGICPLTAAVLMMYQTKYYDYQWIWNLVPAIIVIALAGTLLWIGLMEKYSKQKGRKWKCVGITAAILAIVYLAGSMGNTIWRADEEAAKRQETARILEILTEKGQVTDITLWAPQGIMEYARALDGNIQLPYGRNMWDISLNAYTYDTYGEAENTLYAWMSSVEIIGEGEETTGIDCIDIARELGVTHILLPGNVLPEVLTELEEYLDRQAETVEGYYLLQMQAVNQDEVND